MILAVYGAGGNGKSVMDIAENVNQRSHFWEKLMFVDDVVQTDNVLGFEVMPFAAFSQKYAPTDEVEFVVSLGTPKDRKLVFERLDAAGYRFAQAVHPDAFISPSVKLGRGVIIAPCTILAEAVVGDNTIIYPEAMIGHNVELGNHNLVSARTFIGGYVQTKECAYIGALAALRDRITVGSNSVIALAAAVFKNVPDNCTAIGNPARMMPQNEGNKLF